MSKDSEYRIITDTVDLIKLNGNSNYKYKFKIQEPSDVFFYRGQIKLKCLKLDTGEPPNNAKPGKIISEKTSKTMGGKEAVLVYEPGAKTFPGVYQMEVTFRGKGKNSPVKKTLSAKFTVVDTTPIAIYDLKGKKDYNIDLSDSGDSWKKPVKLQVEGPRNQEIQLDLFYKPVPTSLSHTHKDPLLHLNNALTDPQWAGKFDKKALKLTGKPENDTVVYYPGNKATSSAVVATARSKKTKDKANFTFHFKDIDCEVYYNGRPINNQQTFPVELQYTPSTKFYNENKAYTTTLENKFTILGARHSFVSIKLKWEGEGSGHWHDMASHNKLATGYFSDFTQNGEFWVPGGHLTQSDGTVNYRNIDYVTYGLSGRIAVDVTFFFPQIPPNRPGNNVAKAVRFYLRVGYWGLIKLKVGENDNIELVGKTDTHPDNHYGTQKLIDAIKKVAKAYGEAYDSGKFDINGKKPHDYNKKYSKKLHVNDMSLVKGGRFDHKANLKNPHQEHMFGEEVDISIFASNMTSKQFKWLDSNGKKYGFKRFDAEPEKNPNHFHGSVVPY